MKKLLATGIAAALATALACTAFAQGGASNNEVATAHAHALMAQNAGTLAQAHAHLHHVVNCLVGAKGAGFDAKAGDPCKGQGNGAIPDSAKDPALHARLEHALATAQAGLKSAQLSSVQGEAGKLATALQADTAAKAPASSGTAW